MAMRQDEVPQGGPAADANIGNESMEILVVIFETLMSLSPREVRICLFHNYLMKWHN